MFSPLILILVSIWTATYGDMVCDTLSGVACDFPFRRTADGPEFKTCQRGAEGRTWCATSKIAATGVYDKWGYCNPTTCKEVPSVEDASQKVKDNAACYACIEEAATGPPHNPISLDCLLPCVFKRNNAKCHFLLLTTGTRMCLGSCGFENVMDRLSLASQPPCVKVSLQFTATPGDALATFVTHTSSQCGELCATNFPTQCTAWNWNSLKVPKNKNQCTCLKGQSLPSKTVIHVFSGNGPASIQGQCPPNALIHALNHALNQTTML